MGLFGEKKDCELCGKKIGMMKIELSDGYICGNCYMKFEIVNEGHTRDMTIERAKEKAKLFGDNQLKSTTFKPTKRIAMVMELDFNNKEFHLPFQKKVYQFDDVLDVNLLEDGNPQIKGGLGAAIAGGALFGGTGAVVGSVVGSKKSYIQKLDVKFTMNNPNQPTVYIPLIQRKTKVNSGIYKGIYGTAQEILSTFEIIFNERQSQNVNTPKSTDVTTEIRKFKSLYDDGIISQDEFEQKKKQLLGL